MQDHCERLQNYVDKQDDCVGIGTVELFRLVSVRESGQNVEMKILFSQMNSGPEQ